MIFKPHYIRLSLACLLSSLLMACPEQPADTSGQQNPSETSQSSTSKPVKSSAFTLVSVSPQSLSPIARYSPESGKFSVALPPHADPYHVLGEAEAAQLLALLPLEQRYPVYLNGRQLSFFEPERLEPPACEDHHQFLGQLNPPIPVPENTSFSAVAYAPPLADLPTLHPPAPPSEAELNQMGTDLKELFLQQQGLEAQAAEFEVLSTTSFPFQTQPGGEFELGLFVAGKRGSENHAAFCNEETFWVLGMWEQGRAVVQAGYLHPKADTPEACQASSLVSSFVVNGSLDHVLVQHNTYTVWSYSIYAWQTDTWKEIFRGGGGGC